MEPFVYPKEYDVVVVGGGHAGIEACLAAARTGCETLLLTIHADTIGLMSCNPAVGGLAKGHLVREVDALGGEMGKAIDATGIQFRRLNTSRGPAVRSSRAQADKQAYRGYMKGVLERTERLDVKMATVEALVVEGGAAAGVDTNLGVRFRGRAVVLCTGTFLKGLVHVGMASWRAGRAGEFAAEGLSDSLRSLGFSVGRLKTGTTPRLDGRTIDYGRTVPQPGDAEPSPFSFSTARIDRPQVPCHLTYTNRATHGAIRAGLPRSPLYAGVIRGTGPRYCPSIEDKVVRFPERERHQVFLEPEGADTAEVYPGGLSTSLPYDVQLAMLRTVPGLERVEVVRPGYAIEYDFVDPVQLRPTLETKVVRHLFHAGQLNGTSGYEEAAAQGILAGLNASLAVRGREQVVVGRSDGYVGVLVDDLVTKGATEPYRMFTSRAEFRLLLREDNADLRLSPVGYRAGLLPEGRFLAAEARREAIPRLLALLSERRAEGGDALSRLVEEGGGGAVRPGTTWLEILRRPSVTLSSLLPFDPALALFPEGVREQAELSVKYEGYLRRQEEEAARLGRYEALPVPPAFSYASVAGLSAEVREKLDRVRPATVGQAGRIPGVTPAAVSLLLVALRKGSLERGARGGDGATDRRDGPPAAGE